MGIGSLNAASKSIVMALSALAAVLVLAYVTRSGAGQYVRSAAIAIVPVTLIIVLILQGFTIRTGVVTALTSTVVLGVILRVETRWSQWSTGIKGAAAFASAVTLVLIVVTIIADTIAHTGLGTRFGETVEDISGGSIAIAGLLMIALSIILAAGLPTLAIYFIVSITFAPILVRLGVDVRSAHFVAFYMGTLSLIVPPVAGSAIVAAAIAKTTYTKVAWQLVVMAWPFYVFPIVLLLAPELLLLGESAARTWLIVTSSAVVLVGAQMAGAGWLGMSLNVPTRLVGMAPTVLLFIGIQQKNDLLIAIPGGLVVVATAVLWAYVKLGRTVPCAPKSTHHDA